MIGIEKYLDQKIIIIVYRYSGLCIIIRLLYKRAFVPFSTIASHYGVNCL